MTAPSADAVLTGSVERRTGVALWRQISDRLREEIASGSFDEAGRLPPELDVAARFGVNRHTAREAIAALVREGVLRREQGRGTFVERARRFVYPVGRKTRFTEGLEGQAGDRRGVLIASTYEPAGVDVAEALSLEPGARVLRMETMGLADGRPVSRATTFFDSARFGGFELSYAATGSVTASLKAFGIDDYVRRSTVISAAHASTSDVADLGLSAGSIVLVTVAIDATLDGVPVQSSRTRFPASFVDLSVSSF